MRNINIQGCKVLEDQGWRKYAAIWFKRELQAEGSDVLRVFQNCSNRIERHRAASFVEHFDDIDPLGNTTLMLCHTMEVFDVLDGLQPC